MTDLEARLESALKADAAVPGDPLFRIAILMRRERMLFRRRLLTGALMSLGAAVLSALGLGAVRELLGIGVTWLLVVAATGVALTACMPPLTCPTCRTSPDAGNRKRCRSSRR